MQKASLKPYKCPELKKHKKIKARPAEIFGSTTATSLTSASMNIRMFNKTPK